jgi:hypothetical protein
MPDNIKPSVPTQVLPYGLASAFSEELRIESLVNEYQNGWSTRKAEHLNPRKFFRISRRLTLADWATLRDFYFINLGKPFWFYNVRETVPPFTWDITGAEPLGRYTVVFDGPWSESIGLGRSPVQFGLREVG